MPRIAVIDREKCLKEKCHICIKVCPINRIGQPCVVADKENYPVIDENLCSGCGICVKKCPAKIISIINLKEEAGELIHQYGVNSFRLYNLPIPKKGVIGFVGENGIGKTTALSILSGEIVPNFGDWSKKLSLKDALKFFSGKETTNYFSNLEKIKISFKPQNIESFRSDILVSDFLSGGESEAAVVAAVEKLNLHSCMNKKMNEISGGELQMVVIARSLMQDADLYYFDEPCSYLDIYQRLIVANAIREISERVPVIVVEHDLAVLDYLTDYVYIFYGEPGVYGVVSGLKSSRVGINEYLDGFLTEENIRLRKEPIVFDIKGYGDLTTIGSVLFDYKNLKKKYEGFTMVAEGGNVREGEIIGIVGPNATGKTTFVKMLAGVEKSDDAGESGPNLKISYKPQYLKPSVGKVADVLKSYPMNEEVFEYVSKELRINELVEKECSKLSGGELQRLAISICLSQDADLYLLDEPSAFLDVEQRLSLAKIIKKRIKEKRAAFVVDHDIVFIDNISDRLIVFEGKSGVEGKASPPISKREGMNKFLERMKITMRREKETFRPRINKPDSVLDREQKEKGEYYYI